MAETPNNMTPAQLQEELNKYSKALAEEFAASTALAPENAEEAARDYFRKNLASAMAQVVWLSNNSDSDTVRLNAAKFIIHEALDESNKDGDPIREIMRGLQALDGVPVNSVTQG